MIEYKFKHPDIENSFRIFLGTNDEIKSCVQELLDKKYLSMISIPDFNNKNYSYGILVCLTNATFEIGNRSYYESLCKCNVLQLHNINPNFHELKYIFNE